MLLDTAKCPQVTNELHAVHRTVSHLEAQSPSRLQPEETPGPAGVRPHPGVRRRALVLITSVTTSAARAAWS